MHAAKKNEIHTKMSAHNCGRLFSKIIYIYHFLLTVEKAEEVDMYVLKVVQVEMPDEQQKFAEFCGSHKND